MASLERGGLVHPVINQNRRGLPFMKDRVVFITGAKGGLGSYITRRFLETGATVVGASRSISQQDFPGPNFTALTVDFTKAVAVNDAVQSVITRFGRLAALAHLLRGCARGQSVAETNATP